MNKKNDLHFNASGYYDGTAYEAIKRADQESNKERKKIYDLIGSIYRLCDKDGYRLEGRIVLKNKKTGKVWR